MLTELPLAEYDFTYQAIDNISFPENSGSLWHSVLGKALRELSCHAPQNDHDDCLYSDHCEYCILFRGTAPLNPAITGNNIPVPHIIKVTHSSFHTVTKNSQFTVRILLIAEASKYLATLIRAMYIVGQNGFGEQRKKSQLLKVVQKLDHQNKTVFDKDTPLQEGVPCKVELPEAPDNILLKFTSPYKPTGKSVNQSYLEVDRFIMSVIRRISQYHYFITGKRIQDDFVRLKHLSETIAISSNNLKWQRNTHNPKSKQKKNYKHGWVGHINLDLRQHEALWEYLYLGQWLHAGKNASMGFGQYKITRINND